MRPVGFVAALPQGFVSLRRPSSPLSATAGMASRWERRERRWNRAWDNSGEREETRDIASRNIKLASAGPGPLRSLYVWTRYSSSRATINFHVLAPRPERLCRTVTTSLGGARTRCATGALRTLIWHDRLCQEFVRVHVRRQITCIPHE